MNASTQTSNMTSTALARVMSVSIFKGIHHTGTGITCNGTFLAITTGLDDKKLELKKATVFQCKYLNPRKKMPLHSNGFKSKCQFFRCDMSNQ